jgi:hypothetical protein
MFAIKFIRVFGVRIHSKGSILLEWKLRQQKIRKNIMLTTFLKTCWGLKHHAAKCDFPDFRSPPFTFWTFLKCPKNISTY